MSDLKPPRMPNAPAPTEPSADTTTTTVPAVEPSSNVPVQQPIAEQVPVESPVAPIAQPVAEGLSAAVESTGNAVLDVAVNAFVSMTGCTDADIFDRKDFRVFSPVYQIWGRKGIHVQLLFERS
jgi:hypothetical protein